MDQGIGGERYGRGREKNKIDIKSKGGRVRI